MSMYEESVCSTILVKIAMIKCMNYQNSLFCLKYVPVYFWSLKPLNHCFVPYYPSIKNECVVIERYNSYETYTHF